MAQQPNSDKSFLQSMKDRVIQFAFPGGNFNEKLHGREPLESEKAGNMFPKSELVANFEHEAKSLEEEEESHKGQI